MKFEELEIGKRYYIDNDGTTGVLLWGEPSEVWGEPSEGTPGFKVDQTEHVYSENNDGLVRFVLNDDFNYLPVELDSEELEN
jgi:hypothetical protein